METMNLQSVIFIFSCSSEFQHLLRILLMLMIELKVFDCQDRGEKRSPTSQGRHLIVSYLSNPNYPKAPLLRLQNLIVVRSSNVVRVQKVNRKEIAKFWVAGSGTTTANTPRLTR
jgi:hypothetical protein